jgi:iron complex outermembrane receptor protein
MLQRLKLSASLVQGGSVIAITMALAGGALAQTAGLTNSAPTFQAAVPETETAPAEIVVTGSLIQRAGFEAPTPTTVVGGADLSLGDRPNIAEVLDDLPQFRATSTPATTVGNTNNSASTADLRGLGANRTLTLLNGHRFEGSSDLNTIPQSIVKQVDVVTGGASATWGSGAVSGVVNIILDDKLTGFSVGADGGESNHNDAARYGYNATYGTNFLDGRGHFMIAGDYVKDEGAFDRPDRPNLLAQIFQNSAGQLSLQTPVNYTIINTGGVIIGGKAGMQVFNHDGSLSPLQLGSQTAGNFTVGGNGQTLYDYVAVTSPYQRANLFSRASLDINADTKVWLNVGYTDVSSNFPFFPATPVFTVKADNPFLTSTARAQLAALGATLPLTVGRILTDVGSEGYMGYKSDRQTVDVSLGVDGGLGRGWTYSAYYGHGELRDDEHVFNQQITANFANAIDAVTGPAGAPVCRVNAAAVTVPACVPINLLGSGNISAAAANYAFGSAQQITTSKLDTAGVVVRGHPVSTWAGPVDIAAGAEYRKESQANDFVDPTSLAGGFTSLNFAPVGGSFDVKEGFGEVNAPLLDLPDLVHIEANGAARYSDYSNSGGIWSWKYGATARVVSDVLLRGTYSRDIRSPGINELFSTKGTNIANAQDPFVGQTQANVVSFTGGYSKLVPEIGNTMTIGGSYSPHYVKGLSFSVDYYDIDIKDAISTLSLQDTLNGCFERDPKDPTCGGVITRTSTGTIASVTRTYLNLADYRTQGIDFEASYLMRVSQLISNWDGSLRFRILANHVNELLVNDGVRVTNVAGVVGDTTTFDTPKWRETASVTYSNKDLSADLRARYVGGGIFSKQLGANGLPISNNDVSGRTYTDIGLRYTFRNATLYASIDNLFDTQPPFVTYASPFYDEIGRYYSAGIKVKIW